jgi:hypothetical protein
LGITFVRYPEQRLISIDQIGYTAQILDKFNMNNCKPADTPMTKELLTSEMTPQTKEEQEEMSSVPYREAVGSLMHLSVGTRPDIAKALSEVSRFLSNPGQRHWQAVKRIFRYLQGTKDMKLFLGGGEEENPQLIGFTDSDWGGSEKRRSTTGFTIYLEKSLISWKSRLQTTVALSTTEAEYYAVGEGMKEILYLLPVAENVGAVQKTPIKLNGDNQGCIKLAENNQLTDRSRHIDIKHYFIQQQIEEGKIKLAYVQTQDNVADILTKGVTKVPHMKLLPKLGLFVNVEAYVSYHN